MFQLNENIPEAISEEIKESFKLYWTDSSSCANKVRKVIELIMDNLKIPKTHLKSKKRVRYSLHQRIENFKIKNHNQGELLMAIKWIGNSEVIQVIKYHMMIYWTAMKFLSSSQKNFMENISNTLKKYQKI